MHQIDYKIFNISYHRNATTSFHDYMEQLGITSLHSVKISLEAIGSHNNILYEPDLQADPEFMTCDDFFNYQDNKTRLITYARDSKYNAFSDNPWPMLYKELDASFPNAKFILFVRNADKWSASVTKYFKNVWTYFRRMLYDNVMNNKEYWMHKYNSHNANVINYFETKYQDKSCDKLLVINLEHETNIDQAITRFLNITVETDVKFAKLNPS